MSRNKSKSELSETRVHTNGAMLPDPENCFNDNYCHKSIDYYLQLTVYRTLHHFNYFLGELNENLYEINWFENHI